MKRERKKSKSKKELTSYLQKYISRLTQTINQGDLDEEYKSRLLETGAFKQDRKGNIRAKGFSTLNRLRKEELRRVVDDLKHYDLVIDNVFKEYTSKQYQTFLQNHPSIKDTIFEDIDSDKIDIYKSAITTFATEAYENFNSVGQLSSEEIVDIITDYSDVQNISTLLREALNSAQDTLPSDSEAYEVEMFIREYIENALEDIIFI